MGFLNICRSLYEFRKGSGFRLYIIVIFAVLLSSCLPESRIPDYVDTEKWNLVWSDEFSGKVLNDKKWCFDIGGHGYGNNELQYYTNGENIYLNNGKLIIEARHEKYMGNPYTSARIWTKGKASWTYGKIAVRARLPEGKGVWPAIWMLPENLYEIRWPAGGEIDIAELIGQMPATVHGTLHYGEPHEYHGGSYTLPQGKFTDDFHVFSIEWEPKSIRWYIDGVQYYEREEWFSNDMYNHKEYKYPAPFNKKFILIMNVAVGGSWPGYPDKTTVFPQKMEVDFVRVYKHRE